MRNGGEKAGTGFPIVAAGGLSVSVAALLVEAAAALGTRAGMWDFRAGFALLKPAAYAGLASALVVAVSLASAAIGKRSRGGVMSATAVVLGILAFVIPGSYMWTAKHVPMIHDITTDTQDPPRFVALLEIRKKSPNGAEYGGPDVVEKQRAAYPDIKTLVPAITPAAAFDRALATARRLGWEIAEADPAGGRIEATDTTRWFGFKDDVVIRVTPGTDGGSRVDLRSASRVGKSDIGKNASRIRAFIEAFGG
jgi:uncharacterized protein (DUF1499 family)